MVPASSATHLPAWIANECWQIAWMGSPRRSADFAAADIAADWPEKCVTLRLRLTTVSVTTIVCHMSAAPPNPTPPAQPVVPSASCDFAAAARRHYRDAEFLCNASRFDNSDHLIGFAAECALKGALSKLSESWAQILFGSTGDVKEKRLRSSRHITDIWNNVSILVAGKNVAAFAALFQKHAINPFSDWIVSDRYGPSGRVTSGSLARHIAAAQDCMAALDTIVCQNLGGI